MSVLQHFEEYQKARVKFVGAVAEAATRPQNIEVMNNAGVMQLLRPLLLDNVPSIQQTAAIALGRLANYSEDLAEGVVGNEILPQLVYSLAEQNRFYKKAAAFVLRAVAKHSPDLAQAVVDSNALDTLVPCLEEFDPSVKEAAAWAIGYIAQHTPTLAQHVVDASAVPLLVLCIQEPETGLTPNEQIHIPDSIFALGDDVVMAAANQLLSMPILILMTRLCPDNAAGTVYALVTSIQMVGGTVSGILSEICVTAFGVTNTDFSRLWQLILVTSLAKLVSVLFLPLVPTQLDSDSGGRRHWAAGVFLLCCFFGGLGWALFNIIDALVTSAF